MHYENIALCCEFTRKSMEIAFLYEELIELVEYCVSMGYNLTPEAEFFYDFIHNS